MEAIEPQAGEALERSMARYARVRLEPSPVQVRRARMAVMETAWRSRFEAEASPRVRRLPFAGWSPRRIGLAASAAVFAGLLLGSSVFAASRAGGPLYEARIALEDAAMPSDPAARLQAQIASAQVRLAEAYDAEVRNDQGALSAALHAYSDDAAALAATTGTGAERALAAMQQHREVLLSLLETAPADALPGLNQALASSDNAIEQLSGTEEPGQGAGNPPNGNGQGSGQGNGQGNGVGPAATPAPANHPAATPKPLASPKPGHTPKPVVTPPPTMAPAPTPTPTPKPDHTPKSGSASGNAAPSSPAP